MSKQAFWAIVLGIAFQASAAWGAPPVARLSSPRTSCVAPCAIFFDARGTTDSDLSGHASEMLDLTYTWDFGDPGSGFWNEGARATTGFPHSKNVDTGFVAGHVYEDPGTYTATLTVSDGVSQSTDSLVVSIQSQSSAWSGTNTACIAASTTPVPGSGGCPSGAATFRSSDFDGALAQFGCVTQPGRRCLFRRGDTFSHNGDVRVTTSGPNLIGAYGSGAKPRVNVASHTTGFGFYTGNRDVRVLDLNIVGSFSSGGSGMGLGAPGGFPNRLLVLRVDFSRFDQQIHFRGPSAGYRPGVNIPREVAIVDSTMLDGPGLGGVDVYVMFEQSVFMGNRAGDKFDGANGLGEHILRAKFSHGAVYSHNSMGLLNDSGGRIGCGNIRSIIKHPAGLAVTYYPDGISREFMVADNYFSSCGPNSWDVVFGRTDGGEGKRNEAHRIYVVERNFFTKRFADRAGISLIVEGEDTMVRNNVFDLSHPGALSTTRGARVTMFSRVPPAVPTRRNRFYNNTCFRNPATTPRPGVCIDIFGQVSGAIVKNNLLYDSSGDTTLVNDGGSGTASCSGCNVTTQSNPFVSSSPSELPDFALDEPSPYVDAGEAVTAAPINWTTFVGALDGDDDGNARIDIGAWEIGGAPGLGGSPPEPPILLP